MHHTSALRTLRIRTLSFAMLATCGASLLQAAAPTISGTPASSVVAGKSYSFTPTAKDSDGNKLTFSVVKLPPWASFSSSSGRLAGTPSAAQARAWSDIVISVTDGTTKKSLPRFAILVKPASGGSGGSGGGNAAPKISGSPAGSVAVSTSYSFQPSASDSNGDKLTFSIAGKPAWASFNTSTGKLSGTPSASNLGTTRNIIISVSDGKAKSSLSAFSVAVTQIGNASVSLDWDPPQRNTDGSTLTNLSGYFIHYGRSASSLTQTIEVATAGVTRYVVENLSPGSWHFAVRSYNSAGVESDLSKVASVNIN